MLKLIDNFTFKIYGPMKGKFTNGRTEYDILYFALNYLIVQRCVHYGEIRTFLRQK